jgi:uncharacterized membrane protein
MAPIRRIPALCRWSGRAASLTLLLLPLMIACRSGDEPTAPVGSDLTARRAPVSAEQMRLQAMPPGLRWFETHTHGSVVRSQVKSGSAQAPGSRRIISQPTDLGLSLGDLFSLAYGINESGQVAGSAAAEFGPQSPDAIRWEADGTPVVLPKASEEGQAWANDVNDGGVVVGVDNEVELGGGFIMHAMRWNPDGSVSELPLAAGVVHHSAEAITTDDVVVGWGQLANTETRPIRWDAQGAHILPSQGCCSAAVDVNEAGTAVGYSGEGHISPARWSPSGELSFLPLPPGDNFGFAVGINNLGQVVGTTGFTTGGPEVGSHHAVLWAPDGTPSVLPKSESDNENDFTAGVAINDAGVIGGAAEDRATGQKTAVIWVKHRRVVVPPGISARPFINDISESQLAGGFSPEAQVHAARWTLRLPPGLSR